MRVVLFEDDGTEIEAIEVGDLRSAEHTELQSTMNTLYTAISQPELTLTEYGCMLALGESRKARENAT